MQTTRFSGSYLPEDVTFLLKQIEMPTIDVAEKEHLIQSGTRHYSEMISPERLPSESYLAIFHEALARNSERMARNLLSLAAAIQLTKSEEITIVSLARGGTPIGVLLQRILKNLWNRNTEHFSISIIRDRGIDTNALRWILDEENRSSESILFVDGWTGKGVITEVLAESISDWNIQNPTQTIDSQLVALADLAGCAGIAATSDDYLIPSSILNSTISGLTSRSILNADYIGPDDFHGCLFFDHWEKSDLSRFFVDTIYHKISELWNCGERGNPTGYDKEKTAQNATLFISEIQNEFHIENRNFIKPGIGEATRVLLRRVPDLLLVRDSSAEDVQHAIILAKEKEIPIQIRPTMPYEAVAIIKALEI